MVRALACLSIGVCLVAAGCGRAGLVTRVQHASAPRMTVSDPTNNPATATASPPNQSQGGGTSTPTSDGSAPCTSVRLDVSPPSPQVVGSTVTLTASAAGCGSPQFRFWLITVDPPGVGLVVQAWDASATYTWNTVDSPAGIYGLRVDARHPGASDSGDTTTSLDYLLNPATSGPACTSASLTSSQDSSSITFAASAKGCPSPEFQWWLTDPNGVGLLVQPWSSTSTYTTGLVGTPGTYTIKVEAREHGDSPVEATATDTIIASAAPSPTPPPSPTPSPASVLDCNTISVKPSMASPQAAGTSVTWTVSSDCQNAEYRFSATIGPPPYDIRQDWSTSSTWVETESTRGTYVIQVWARDPATGRVVSNSWIYYTFS